MTNQDFLTIKEAAQCYSRSEQTIRRLVKQHKLTKHIRSTEGPKGKTYQISQALLRQEYDTPLIASIPIQDKTEREINTQSPLDERDLLIQQLQNRLLDQNERMNSVTSQRINHIEQLLIQQNAQLIELQKQLLISSSNEELPNQRSLWQRLFGL